MATLKATQESLDKLKVYEGKNPYILALKRDVFVKGYNKALNDLAIDYINRNYQTEPKQLDKTIKLGDWYAEKLKEKWGCEFLPNKLKCLSYLGETSDMYHCLIQYRKSVEPELLFIPKKAVLKNFLVEDYRNLTVDFDRYNRLMCARRPEDPRYVLPHQEEAVKFLVSRKKCILADDMGLGKSSSLSIASIEGNFDCVLIICPASLKTNWLNELSYFVSERDITIIGGCNDLKKVEIERYLGYGEGKSGKSLTELQNEAKERGKWSDNRYVIINFDILNDVYQIPETRSKENIQKAYENSPMLRYIDGKKTLIIVDEAHRLSNLKADRYKIIKDLIKRGRPDSIYLATGTPITNDPQNFYNLLDLLDDPITDDWQYYMERYCGAKKICKNAEEKAKRDNISRRYISSKGKNTWYELTDDEKRELNTIVSRSCKMITVAKDASNLDELKDRTAHLYLRRTKEDLENKLPQKFYHEYFYDLTMEQEMEYAKLWEEYEAQKLEENPDKELNKELIEGGIYRRYLSNQMIPYTEKLVDKCLKRGEKVIIACCYDEELYTFKDYYGDKCVIYNGKISQKEKDIAKEKFLTDPNVMVFIGNIISAGVGLTLISSRIVVFNNISFVPGDNQQMCDRVYRIGQKRDVHIFYQFFKNTQYEKMWNTVLKKELVINQVIKKENEK